MQYSSPYSVGIQFTCAPPPSDVLSPDSVRPPQLKARSKITFSPSRTYRCISQALLLPPYYICIDSLTACQL